MKLAWSPETASKAYIDTVKLVSNFLKQSLFFLLQIAFFPFCFPFLMKSIIGFCLAV